MVLVCISYILVVYSMHRDSATVHARTPTPVETTPIIQAKALRLDDSARFLQVQFSPCDMRAHSTYAAGEHGTLSKKRDQLGVSQVLLSWRCLSNFPCVESKASWADVAGKQASKQLHLKTEAQSPLARTFTHSNGLASSSLKSCLALGLL